MKIQNLRTVYASLSLPDMCEWRQGVNEGPSSRSKVEQDEEVMALPELRLTWTDPGQCMERLTHVELYETLENLGRTGLPLRPNETIQFTH